MPRPQAKPITSKYPGLGPRHPYFLKSPVIQDATKVENHCLGSPLLTSWNFCCKANQESQPRVFHNHGFSVEQVQQGPEH